MNIGKMKLSTIVFLLFSATLTAVCREYDYTSADLEDSAAVDSLSENFNIRPRAYSPASQMLYAEILHMDSVLFNAFNAHDAKQMEDVFSLNLEFYHDKGGLTDLKQTVENFKSLFERNQQTGLRRELDRSSLEVYSIKDFGALEVGVHKFCHTENGKEDCGTFKFIHIWKKADGQWRLTRVISYDH